MLSILLLTITGSRREKARATATNVMTQSTYIGNMAIFTLGKSKQSKVANSIVLVLILTYAGSKLLDHYGTGITSTISNTAISAVYSEIELSGYPISEYAVEDINEILLKYKNSEIFVENMEELNLTGQLPDLFSQVYQDEFMDENIIGWAVRFEADTDSISFERAQLVVNSMAKGLMAYLKLRNES